MLRDFVTFLQDRGYVFEGDVVSEFYRHTYGESPSEWTQDQKKNVRKAVSKALSKYEARFQVKPTDQVCDYLWHIGWEYKEIRGQVFGVEKFVDNWVDRNYPADAMDLSREERDDPYLKEITQILSEFYVTPDDRECRMILRARPVAWCVRYACELFRASGRPLKFFTVHNILKEANYRWEVRNDRNCDAI